MKPVSAKEGFETMAARAADYDALAAVAEKNGDQARAKQLRSAASHARQRACGFDSGAAWKDFHRCTDRVSVRLNAEMNDAIASFGIGKRDRAAFLAALLEEALYAIQAGRLKRSGGRGAFYTLRARQRKPGEKTLSFIRAQQHVAAVAGAEFAVRAACHVA